MAESSRGPTILAGTIIAFSVLLVGVALFMPDFSSEPDDRAAETPPISAAETESISPDNSDAEDAAPIADPVAERVAEINARTEIQHGQTILHQEGPWALVLYVDRDFEAVMRHLEGLYAMRNNGRGGARYGSWFNGMATPVSFELPYEERLDIVEAWKRAHPDSHFPHVLEAHIRMKLAWEHRGSSLADKVTDEGWEGFYRELQLARNAIDRANRMNSEDAQASIIGITVSMGLNDEDPQTHDYFLYATERSPQRLAAWNRRYTSLLPKWGGDIDKLYEFVLESQRAATEYPQLATIGIYFLNDITRWAKKAGEDPPDPEPEIAKLYAAMDEAYPKDPEMLNRYAVWALDDSSDPFLAAKLFDRMNDTFYTAGFNGDIERYLSRKAHAYIRYAQANGDGWYQRIEDAYKLAPHDEWVAYQCGATRAAVGRLGRAKEPLRKSIENNPDYVFPYLSLAHILIHEGDFDAAEAMLSQLYDKELTESQADMLDWYMDDARAGQHVDIGKKVIHHKESER